MIDFFSTFTALANVQLKDDVKRDGIDISGYFINPEKERDPRPYFYWHVGYIQAVRYGDWKVSLLGGLDEKERANIAKSTYRKSLAPGQIELYNLRSDPGETNNVADKHPEILDRIIQMAEKERRALGEYTNKGPEVRKTIWVESPVPLVK